MATPFVNTVFWVMVTLNNAGQLAPVEKADLPPGLTGPIAWSEGQCMYNRGRMQNPEEVTCQQFTSAPTTKWLPPGQVPEVSPSAVPQGTPEQPAPPERRSEDPVLKNDDVRLAGGHYHYSRPLFWWVEDNSAKVAEADKPYIEPRAEPAAQPTARAKRVVHRQQYQPGPFDVIASLLTGNW